MDAYMCAVQTSPMDPALQLQFRPVTDETRTDLSLFLQRNPAFRECSCMKWRLRSAVFMRMGSKERTGALKSLVAGGTPVGILAYSNDVPVGWCSIAPRRGYRALEKSTGRGRIDDTRVWSVVCFFVDTHWRRKGISLRLPRCHPAGRQAAHRAKCHRIVEPHMMIKLHFCTQHSPFLHSCTINRIG